MLSLFEIVYNRIKVITCNDTMHSNQAKTFVASLIDPDPHHRDTKVDVAHRIVGDCNTVSELPEGNQDSNTWRIFVLKYQSSHLQETSYSI